jgi:predicted nucleic acid-binding protein
VDILADTNILVRGVHRQADKHREALKALRVLRSQQHRICVVPQNLYEFWAIATRPVENNGLALTPVQADRLTSRITELCLLLRDPPDLFDEWRRLVRANNVSGKNVHDARLVAAMRLHLIQHILTFNIKDFARYPRIEAVHPRNSAAGISLAK